MKFFNAIWPSSLWGRLSLLLLSALMVAQLASAMLHFRDRGAALLQAAGIESAQRIAGIVRILDPLTPAQRDEVVDALDFPPLRLGLADSPSPLPNGDTRSSRAVLFKRMLQLQLDQGRQLDVTLRSSTELQKERPYELQSPDIASSTPMQGMMAHHTGGHAWARDLHTLAIDPSFSFLVQVRLHGGQWAHFAYFIPEDTIHWPWDLFWALLLLTLVVIVVSFLAVRWLTRPLTELATAADELGKDIQHPPLPETGPTEVHRAARAFNQMQSRLRSFVEERTRILAAVSHDLKTPITRMRLRVEAIENETLREHFQGDLDDMQTLVQGSLDFMRGMAIQEKSQPLDINSLLESLRDDADDMGHMVSIQGSAQTPYKCKPLALKRCLNNLIDNAIRYGHEADIKVQDDKEQLVITVRDRGPGIAEADRERVFEPFQRLEPSRNPQTGGTGLGLGIARNIARCHGGDITLHDNEGGGLAVRLTLPR